MCYYYTLLIINLLITKYSDTDFDLMKAPTLKKFNLTMALQWLIFLPVILPLCVIFGAFQGVVGMVEKMANRMWIDMEL